MDNLKFKNRYIRHLISTPFIWSAIIPLIITDIWIEIYHRICFPLYGLKYIQRSKYIKIDRQKLNYLKPKQKISCMYCGYANGAINYWTQIIAQTEKYWCGIAHQEDPNFIPPQHHKDLKFAKFGDEKEYNKKYKK